MFQRRNVRKDLPFQIQLVQSCHACIEATKLFKQPEETVFLVICTAKNEEQLYKLFEKSQENGISCTIFQEPDLDNQFTSFATEPIYSEKRDFFKHLQLLKGENHEHNNVQRN